MSGLTYFILALALFCVIYYVVPPVVRAYLKFRGRRLITCPETRTPFGVEVDVKHALSTAAISREPELRLKSCSRWPERQDCDQECLLQVRVSPADTLIQTIFATWYQGKKCVYCAKPFGEVHWFNHRPALLSPEGVTLEWQDVLPERLPDVLASHKPVCWDCHICETFRREYADVVIDRPYINSPEEPRPHV